MTNQPKSYFNVIVHCVGYINKIEEKNSPDNAQRNEVRISVAVLFGDKNNPSREFYSLSVDKDKEKELLLSYASNINDDSRVLASMIISKSDTSVYTFKDGKRKGQLGFTHFGSLREIKGLKVDGTDVLQKKGE